MNEIYIGVALQILMAIILPLIFLIYLHQKKLLSWKSFFVGILIFILFSQIFEKIVHFFVLAPSGSELKWTGNPYLFALYGGLAAGVFEEFGRYFAFKIMLKNKHSYPDGISYGLGHGGIEAILFIGLSSLNTIFVYTMLQSGKLEELVGSQIPAEQLETLRTQFDNASVWIFAADGFERIFAICLHIALSILVLYAVRKKRFSYVIYAILIHAAVNFLPGLYQSGVISSILFIEIILFIVAIASVLFIIKMKQAFEKA